MINIRTENNFNKSLYVAFMSRYKVKRLQVCNFVRKWALALKLTFINCSKPLVGVWVGRCVPTAYLSNLVSKLNIKVTIHLELRLCEVLITKQIIKCHKPL